MNTLCFPDSTCGKGSGIPGSRRLAASGIEASLCTKLSVICSNHSNRSCNGSLRAELSLSFEIESVLQVSRAKLRPCLGLLFLMVPA